MVNMKEIQIEDQETSDILRLSKCWEIEQNTYGYVANTINDLKHHNMFIIKDDKHIFGYLLGHVYVNDKKVSALAYQSDVFEIDEIYIEKSYRSKGYGMQLFQKVEQIMSNKVSYIVLSSSNKDSKRILKFYQDNMDMRIWSTRLFKKTRKM